MGKIHNTELIYEIKNILYIHWSIKAMSLVQSKWRRKSSVHTSMNVRKMKFISYIYPLFLNSFCSLFGKFWSKSCKKSGEEKLLND